MKEFYDLEALSRTLDFDGKMLCEAIRKTFERRGRELPPGGTPIAFTPEFYDHTGKKQQWTAFRAKNATYVAKSELKEVIENIKLSWCPSPRLCSAAVQSLNAANRADLGASGR
jgi:Nucleotidyl transferase AbiEii toxin, Type IV TA system